MTQQLLDGVRRFRTAAYPPRKERFEALASGQSPNTLFVTCSDSRIDPSLITQTEPGELFVIRNAGNLIPACGVESSGGEAATLEYAVVVLGVKDIVVCGHSHCGAMAALLAPDTLDALPEVRSWLGHAESTLEKVRAAGEGADAVRLNVVAQLENLRSYPFVREREERGELALHGWVYVFERGDILALGRDGAFAPLLSGTSSPGVQV